MRWIKHDTDANQDAKLQNVLLDYGLEGYGLYWYCKELVYKYAMWVNAEFEIKVIQTFDSVVNKLNTPSSMAALNELTAKIESDKSVASFCGKELAKYKKIKKENEQAFAEEVLNAQLTLGFKGGLK